MSIVTLKRKAEAKYNNSSVGKPQFSLNGTTRNSGYIGQDMLGRSLVRSISKNGALKGHGGCCGKYPTPQINTTPEMSCLNNSAIVKSSSLTTNGLLMSRHRWIRRPQPHSIIKPDNNAHNNIQSTYIDNLARKTILDGSNCHIINKDCPKEYKISNTNFNVRANNMLPITKPDSFLGAVNASEHVRKLTNKCASNDDFKHLNTNKNVPFACSNSSSFKPLYQNRNDIRNPGLIGGTNAVV